MMATNGASTASVALPARVVSLLACPACGGKLLLDMEGFRCAESKCGQTFPIVNGIPILIDPNSSLFTFDDYLADFRADLHDIHRDAAYAECLNPNSYASSPRLARELLALGSAGIVYPSVRRASGTCLVCFRPALVTHVRQGGSVTFTFCDPSSPPLIS